MNDSFQFSHDYKINNNFNGIKTDELLYNKISNINKINKPVSINDSFINKNYFNNQDENNYTINNNNNNNYNKNVLTNIPNSNKNKNEPTFIENICIPSPFRDKNKISNFNDFSSNYYLLSNANNNKEKKLKFYNDSKDINPINRFNYFKNNEREGYLFGKRIP